MDERDRLFDILQNQMISIPYVGLDETSMHKSSIYQAFINLLNKDPKKLISYLTSTSHHYGMQHKLFQEYVSILESKIPFSFSKNQERYWINSLLDDHLNVFDGLSVFDAPISDKKSIKNMTKEFYIGARAGYYSRPYYIGKLLDVIDLDTDLSIKKDVLEYSFSKIKLDQSSIGKRVRVSHLRVIPHYQAASMSILNRIRKKITNEFKLLK
jgi:hypothetical protein